MLRLQINPDPPDHRDPDYGKVYRFALERNGWTDGVWHRTPEAAAEHIAMVLAGPFEKAS